MRRSPALISFFVATFAWSWSLWALATRLDLPAALSDGLVVAGRAEAAVPLDAELWG